MVGGSGGEIKRVMRSGAKQNGEPMRALRREDVFSMTRRGRYQASSFFSGAGTGAGVGAGAGFSPSSSGRGLPVPSPPC